MGCRTLLIAIVTCVVQLLVFNAARARDDVSIPYDLSTENSHEEQYRQNVIPYWKDGIDGTFRGVDNIRIKFSTFERSNAKGKIVVCSGRTECMTKYQETIYDLGKQGYSIYIYDHRGQGFSGRILRDKPELGHVKKFDNYVKDLNTFVNEIVKPSEEDHLVLLAHSMGGCIASRYLETRSHPFDLAVLCSPMHEPGTGFLSPEIVTRVLDLKIFFRPEQLQDYVPGKGEYEAEAFSEDNPYTHSKKRYKKILKLDRLRPDTRIGGPSVQWFREAYKAGKAARKEAGKIEIPVLLINAGADSIVTEEGQIEFCRELNRVGPGQCRFLKIRGAYHELFVESDKYRIPALTAVLNFIDDPNCPLPKVKKQKADKK